MLNCLEGTLALFTALTPLPATCLFGPPRVKSPSISDRLLHVLTSSSNEIDIEHSHSLLDSNVLVNAAIP